MVRIARIVLPGLPHHVSQRGNNRQNVFLSNSDREFYSKTLHKQSEKFGFCIHAYCLMANHIHLIGTPETNQSLAKAIGRTHLIYTQYFNGAHNRSGHLWQNRFYSCALDNKHAWFATAYIERNPVRANIVQKAWEYPWSSAAEHCGQQRENKLLKISGWESIIPEGPRWEEILSADQDAEETEELLKSTQTGLPLGSSEFISRIEHEDGRSLKSRPVGRPRKNW